MRALIFDELRKTEAEAVGRYLDEKAERGSIEGLYWLRLPAELLTERQRLALAEAGEGPELKAAVELGDTWVRFELLLRSETLHNIGAGPATEAQALFLLRWAAEMADTLDLKTCLGLRPDMGEERC